jgi:hypothetical protein
VILRRSTSLKNLRAQAHAVALAGGTLLIYGGAMPATGGGDITDQVLLAAFNLPVPVGTVDDGVFALAAVADVLALADGIAAWVRVLDSVDGWLMDLDAGGAGSGAAIIISPAQLYAGGVVRIERLRLIEP